MGFNVVVPVVQSDVDCFLVGPPHQDVTSVHVTVLKLQCLRVYVFLYVCVCVCVLKSCVFHIYELFGYYSSLASRP